MTSTPEYMKEYRAANADRLAQQVREYREHNRSVLRERQKAYYAANRELVLTRDRARYPERRALRLSQHAAWQKARPDLIRIANAKRRALRAKASVFPIRNESFIAKWAYWGGKCWMCGDNASTWDHVKPLAKGGLHILANLRPACKPCNSGKKDRWPL